ncbi:hypothetical protein DWY99_03150 [[Clostridium] leptum]|uniref:Sigma-70 family RNA polymerase sigma factor n=1 Tax=[Clostridium] leptum TaxID=1535 RepID=A0A412B034_9FIRM|nr:hypothetical protein DWY99_03150 [[Clostridium] leptum]
MFSCHNDISCSRIDYDYIKILENRLSTFMIQHHVIIDSRKAEHAQDERHRYHCYSYDAIDYEGEEYGACDEYAVEDDSAEQTARIREAFSHLTATQQRRLRLYANGKTLREIAAIEEASFQSVSESIEAGRKKFLKFFRQTP